MQRKKPRLQISNRIFALSPQFHNDSTKVIPSLLSPLLSSALSASRLTTLITHHHQRTTTGKEGEQVQQQQWPTTFVVYASLTCHYEDRERCHL